MHKIAHWALFIVTCVGVPGAIALGCGSSGGQGSTTNTAPGGAAGHGGATGTGGTTGTGGSAMTGTGGSIMLTTGSGGTGGTVMAGTGGATGTGGTAMAGSGGATTASTGTGSVTTAASSTGSGGTACVPTNCQGHIYQCGDCIDNDGDGLIDSEDPDCLGPCDNTEDSYFGGIPGQAGPACTVDCYFDQDSGSGNDDCHWNHKCDPHEVTPAYYPEHDNSGQCAYDPNANTPGTSGTCDQLYNTQSDTCMNFCGPLTPNGCDCFGCCELPAGTGKYVWLGSTVNGAGSCDMAHVSDPTKCQPCMPVKACLNTCEHCELCLGKTTLPPDCFPDGGSSSSSSSSSSSTTTSSGSTTSSSSSTSSGSTTTSSSSSGSTTSSSSSSSSSGSTGQCIAGVQPCGLPGESPCPSGYYCITGCCQKIPQ